MAIDTAIAWCTSTFNPWIGCTKVGPGCDHCYAAVSTPARAMHIHWGAGEARHKTSSATWAQVRRWNARQAALLAADPNTPPWRVFCASLADVFDNEVDPYWRRDLFDLIESTPHLSWLLVTKRIGNVRGMMPSGWISGGFPDHVRLMITVVDQVEAERDVPKLLALPCRNGVSYEPALGAVNWHPFLQRGLEWVIVGGESGLKARPFFTDWARSTVLQCKAASVPCFVKQMGSFAIDRNDRGFDGCEPDAWPLRPDGCDPDIDFNPFGYVDYAQGSACRIVLMDRGGSNPQEWPETLRVQEFPR